VYKLRGGRESQFLEESGALFVTANSGLCSVATEFFIGEKYMEGTSVPVAVPDYALTTLLWVKTPMNAPSLPTTVLIAECYAALQPNARLWTKYMETVERLQQAGQITPDEYYLLRHSQLSHKELMSVSMGDEAAITANTVQEMLHTVIMSIRKDDLAALDAERKRHAAEISDTMKKIQLQQLQWSEVEKQLTAEQQQRNAALEATQRQLLAEQAARVAQLESIISRIGIISRRVAKGFSLALLITLGALAIVGSAYSLINVQLILVRYVIAVGDVVLLVFGAYHLIRGDSLKDIVGHIENFLARKLESLLQRLFVPPQKNESHPGADRRLP
jgi:hypothetical protein